MISPAYIRKLESWLENYVNEFKFSDGMHNANIRLKINLKTLSDFKLLQMAWIYDINFPITCRLIRERQYLEKIKESLPQTGKIQKVFETVKSHLKKMPDN